MAYKLIAIFLLQIIPFISKGQPAAKTASELWIRVTGHEYVPLSHSTVRLLKASDSSEISTSMGDSLGNVVFYNIPSGDYIICGSRVNYINSCLKINIPVIEADQQRSIQNVTVLNLQFAGDLETVTVTGRKNPVVFKADRTIIQVDAAINNIGTTALEVLERSPGVTVDKDGNISLKGRNNVLVMLDGKPSYLGSAELSALLSGMSSSQVEQIELIDNPSAKYDAAGNAGIINIILKKNKQRGFNGNLSTSPGMGRYGKSNNNVGLNYKNGKINIFGNYSYNANENFLKMFALRTYLKEDEQTIISQLGQPTFMKSNSITQSVRTGIDYALNKKTTLGAQISGTFSNRNNNTTGIGSWLDASSQTDSLINTFSQNNGKLNNAAINFNFRHTSNERHEFITDLDWVEYSMSSHQLFQNERIGSGAYKEAFKGDLPSFIRIMAIKGDHTMKLPNNLKLESGIKYSKIDTDNVADYYADNNGSWERDFTRTNNFIYTEHIRAVYTSLSRQAEKWNFQLGARYENTFYEAAQFGNPFQKDSSFSKNYGSIFPNVQIGIVVDSLNELSLLFGKRIDRPAYQKLNPFVYIINKYTYMSGNPLIRPQYTYNIELNHTYNNFLNTSLTYSIAKDYFSQIFFTDSIGTVFYSDGNLGKRQTLGLSIGFNYSISPAWSFNLQTDIIHKKMNGFIWKELEARVTQMSANLNTQVRLGKGWNTELSGYYITRSQADIQEVVEPTGQLSIGVSKQILKNKGSLKLSLRDIFYTQDMEGFTIFNQSTEYFRFQRDTRLASISFTYRFGKEFKSSPARRAGGVSDEIQRAG